MRAACLAAVAAFLFAAQAGAEAIQATVDRQETTVEEPLVLTITVFGSQTAQPRLPELPDFDVRPAGTATQIQIINGQATASVSHNFRLVPRRAGTFTVGPASVEIEGRTYQSQPFAVRILPASERPVGERELFLTATVSDREPFVGQQVLYTWKFYRRVRIGDARLEGYEFPGFAVEDLGDIREYQAALDGKQYLVSEFRRALFPQREGRLAVKGPDLTCTVVVQRRGARRSLFDDVFGRLDTETRVLRSEPVELTVRPLPPAPPGFSGLIGRFAVASELSKREVQVGESTTWRLSVSGSGNAQLIGEPPLPELAAFKVYADKPEASLDRSFDGLTGRKSWSKALVPLAPGELALPALSLTYFDPASASYRTASSEAIPLRVVPAAGREDLRLTESVAPTTGKVAVKILADDILPLHRGLGAVASQRLSRAAAAAWAGGLLLPPLAWAGLLALRRRRQRHAQDGGLRRRRQALRKALHAAQRALREAEAGREALACELASRSLCELVGDKLGLAGNALTPTEVDEILGRRGLPPDVVERTHRLLAGLEAARYGARPVAGAEIAADLRPLLAELDRRLTAA
jgi:hypothetical protein